MTTHINPKSRKLFVMASVCLAVGLLLPMLFHPAAQPARNLLHFVCGLLLGLSLSVNLALLWKNSRRRGSSDSQAESS
jgi:peptidoglycan/LPS O-acetylase OafA/YrhL